MKKLFITRHGAVSLDTETQNALAVDYEREAIANIYLCKEPTQVIYGIGETEQEIYAEEDDIVIQFYSSEKDFPNKIVVAKSAQWVDNLKNYNEAEQKRKEEWAAKQSDDCDECGKAAA